MGRGEKKRGRQKHQKRGGGGGGGVKKALLWSAVILLAAAGLWGVARNLVPSSHQAPAEVKEVSASDQTRGNPQARVVLVEYSDFQCPACRFYYPLAEKISREYGDRLLFVYRHFPLQQHRHAREAAWAAEAAGRQGKFWEMHDLLFERQKDWSDQGQVEETFAGWAESLGLNREQFEKDFRSKAVADKVENDYRSGLRAGLRGTPTFYLNGEKIANPRSLSDFKKLIDKALGSVESGK
jgi:protein-disulfide isomerase